MKKNIDTTDCPKVIYGSIDDKEYRPEFELLDRFHIFSAELLRLSLLGIAVFGFLYEKLFSRIDKDFPSLSFYHSPKWSSGISILLFSVSAAAALAHRYFSTDAARFYLHGLRIRIRISKLDNSKNEDDLKENYLLGTELKRCIKKRDILLTRCMWLKFLSSSLLGLGAVLMGYALFRLLIMQIAPSIPK